VLLALAVLPPFFINDYVQYILNTILVYSVVTIGFNIVLGYAGQLAFANAAFFGVGAYTTAICMSRWNFPFLLALVAASAVTGLVGLIVSLPALRLRAYYLAIVTLAFGELLRWGYIHADWLTLGSSGLPVPIATIFGIRLASDRSRYWLFLALTVLVLWASSSLLRSRFGRALVAVRENEAAAAAMGIAPALTKIGAFAWSGCVVGIAGAMFALLLGRINPESFDLSQLLLHFTLVMIGGLGSLAGSVAGAILLTAAPELLRNVAGLEEIVFSLLLIGVLLYLPKGLGGLLSRIPALRERLYMD
jgi:branched-chain amino acid transport system permease protein